MEILGIGWQELLFIVVIALIVLGPRDMQRAGRTIGRWLNQLVQSDSWKIFQKTSTELRNLPRNLMREANMEMRQTEEEIRQAIEPRIYPPGPRPSSPRPGNETKSDREGKPSTDKTVASTPADEWDAALNDRDEVNDARNPKDTDEHV
jgi:sec-independent protein translocase protein TatB